MAPKNKRVETTEESQSEICKRLKDEAGAAAVVAAEETDKKPQAKDEAAGADTEKHNNNNNVVVDGGDKDKNKNGSEEESKVADEVINTKKQEDEADLNGGGDKKEVEPEATKTVSDDGKKQEVSSSSSSTNGKKETTKTEAAVSDATTTSDNPPKSEEETIGTILICGGANWDMTGRKELPKTAKKPAALDPAARNLWEPHRIRLDGSDKNLRVRGVFSGCNACHSVIVTDDGLVMTFGRNDKGQLGLGDTETRTIPVIVEALKGVNIVAAACGRSHTLFLDSDGIVYSCGDNKMGQCGTNQMAVQQITTPTRIAFKENKPVTKMACGAEFSMIADNDGRLYSFGHPEHGQLGHNSEGKYFTTGNKYAFHCEYQPRRIVTFIEKSREGHISPVDDVSIIDIACGTNHTLVVDKKHRCFSWGFGGYHRLGHSDNKNELVPRSIKVFDAPNNTGRGAARVFAGATHSMALDVNGLLYFWGQNKSSGEATMYPKNVQDLCGWRVSAVSCASRSIFVIADESCISWGPSPTYGELGYGEGKSKSSTTPQEVRTLDGVSIKDVACGFGHTLLIARDSKPEDQTTLNKLRSWP